MLHNTIYSRTAKNPQRLESQGFADFAFYAKHGHNLYYTYVFPPVCRGIAGVFVDDGNQNGERNGCCTHNNTPRNPTYCHTQSPPSHTSYFHIPLYLIRLFFITPYTFRPSTLFFALICHSYKHL